MAERAFDVPFFLWQSSLFGVETTNLQDTPIFRAIDESETANHEFNSLNRKRLGFHPILFDLS